MTPPATPLPAPLPSPPPLLRVLAITCVVGAVLAIIVGLVAHQVWGTPLAYGLGVFLLFFGFGKLVVALNQLAVRRPGPDGALVPAPHFASPLVFRVYLVIKVTVWITAWCAAVYLFNHPAAFVLR